jgi:hypothetical protein
MRHARRPVAWVRLKHRLDDGLQAAVYARQVGYATALFHNLELRAAHLQRLAAKRRRENQPETVNVRLVGHVAAKEAELFGET